MVFLYRLSITFYHLAIWLAMPFSRKARKWVNGRKGWREDLSVFEPGSQGSIWLHCASLGEFEQGRPLLEEIRERYPESRIVLTFFSPSGYEVRKSYPHADIVCYLPADSPANARDFLDRIRPRVAIFIKYELWFFYLKTLHQRQIPVQLVSAYFPPNHSYTRGLQGRLFKRMLTYLDRVFTQDEASAQTLNQLAGRELAIANGDTRFDRVLSIAQGFRPVGGIKSFIGERRCVVAGSTWPADERPLLEVVGKTSSDKLCLILAPHHIGEAHIRQIMERAGSRAVLFSALKEEEPVEKQILVIDNIGMLSRLYHYADLCYVGGGFGKGIHNTLEAAVHGKLTLFGPNHERFREAKGLLACGGAKVVQNAQELSFWVQAMLNNDAQIEEAGQRAEDFVAQRTGATDGVMAYLEEAGLLPEAPQPEMDFSH